MSDLNDNETARDRAAAIDALAELIGRFGWNRHNDCIELRYARAVLQQLRSPKQGKHPGTLEEFKEDERRRDLAACSDEDEHEDENAWRSLRTGA